MFSNKRLVSIGTFDLKYNHLLLVGILILSFTISALVRSQAAEFGFELNEFDPFYNYRATQYMVDNGIVAYFEWHDDLSWYPDGRDISKTSQIISHLTAAITYWIFGGGMDLYDFTIIFPVVFGSFSAIALFALVRVIGGTTAGMFAALLYSISLPILIRGPIGWFKSEPLGLFLGILMVYLFLSGIKSQNKKIAFAKLASAGVFTAFAISAWGGNQFLIIPLGLFFLVLPFLRTDHMFLIWAVPVYTTTALLSSMSIEVVSSSFLFGLGGISLAVPTIFIVACILVQQKSKKNKTRNGLILLMILVTMVPLVLAVNSEFQFLPSASHRYLNALNPLLTTTNPLVDSISEHATPTIAQSFQFHSVLMIFAGIGIWLLFKNIQDKNPFVKIDMLTISLILGFVGVYVGSTFIRLEVFTSISIIVLASLGLTGLSREFFKKMDSRSIVRMIKIPYAAGIIVLLMSPLVLPVGADLFSVSRSPPTILNGGTNFGVTTNDWLDSLEWIKNNTPEDAVFAAWWDYGYWISTMAERATLADNSTMSNKVIANIARMMLNTPDESWNMLEEMDADYVLIFIAGQKLDTVEGAFYILHGGGDESKKQWFMRIGGLDSSVYLQSDGFSGTDYFWNETLLGQMMPFSLVSYLNPNDASKQFQVYLPGSVGVYAKDIKMPADGNGPLRLVYASPSFVEEKPGVMLGIFVYEVNKDYKPAS